MLAFLSSADYCQNQLFKKILSGIQSEWQTVWIQIRPDKTYKKEYEKQNFAYWVILLEFLLSDFVKINLYKNSLRNACTIRVANSLDPDQNRQNIQRRMYEQQNFAYWVILRAFLSPVDFGQINFSEKSFKNTIRVVNSLDPDQARHFVGHDPGPNCLQRLLADYTS